jgi:polyisoprenoid-binding protein YceI
MPRALWIILATAILPANGAYTVAPKTSTVTYTIVHKFHSVEGKSSDIEGKAVVKDDGTIQAMVRVPVASFRSGDGNRDEHMLEAVEGAKFPYVTFKGIASLGPDRALPSTALPMQGEVEFHGVTHPVSVPLALEVQPDGSVRGHGSFDVSLDAYGVERPSLLFIKIDDKCHIDLDLVLRESR